jgi:hypothetical protein
MNPRHFASLCLVSTARMDGSRCFRITNSLHYQIKWACELALRFGVPGVIITKCDNGQGG